jgi:FkbM family methyltransferase
MSGQLRSLLRRSVLYRPLRTLYHSVFYSRSVHAAFCAGMTRRFSTPTPTLAEHVRTLTGEGPVLEEFLGLLREDDSVWDVGAGFGMYALFASGRIGARGSIHAFEPEARIRLLLERNIGLNNAPSVSIHPLALGDTDGTVALFPSDSPNMGTSSLAHRHDYPVRDPASDVPMQRGDTCIERGMAPPPTVVKIDVEGAEGKVLAGLSATLASGSVRMICCEVHPHLLPLFGTSAGAVESVLRASGFQIALRYPRGTEYHLLAILPQ